MDRIFFKRINFTKMDIIPGHPIDSISISSNGNYNAISKLGKSYLLDPSSTPPITEITLLF